MSKMPEVRYLITVTMNFTCMINRNIDSGHSSSIARSPNPIVVCKRLSKIDRHIYPTISSTG